MRLEASDRLNDQHSPLGRDQRQLVDSERRELCVEQTGTNGETCHREPKSKRIKVPFIVESRDGLTDVTAPDTKIVNERFESRPTPIQLKLSQRS